VKKNSKEFRCTAAWSRQKSATIREEYAAGKNNAALQPEGGIIAG